ncbi:hypothetical protein Trco_006764 [Trichoderma cornu-damae]|uniref:Uncharacterized protein n=1 Tax=Trichoderma cornu-damae TaxID=654480 RepID=A0A9P8QM56_9HYPO|nr:hypothetical protein Trco_006764 [Trichoderma cornu-damae]
MDSIVNPSHSDGDDDDSQATLKLSCLPLPGCQARVTANLLVTTIMKGDLWINERMIPTIEAEASQQGTAQLSRRLSDL